MGTQDTGKVIPLFSGSGESHRDSVARGAMHDLSLARRRGFETVEQVRPQTPPAAETPFEAGVLTTSRLSAAFIESLDDMIRGVPARSSGGSWPSHPSATLEKVAVDIVDMLFGMVVGEALVPRGIKEALLRAQLPVLQMAMRDTAFFSDWQHPARKLLNGIPGMIRAYIERGGAAERFEQRFVAALDRTLDLVPGAAAFAALHDELTAFAHDAPIAEITDESEAWDRAQAVARDFLERPLPQLARDFLTDYWIDVLQRTALTQAPDSPQWLDAVAAIEDLAWSLTPKPGQEERIELIGRIPALLARLNRGLDLIDVPRDERRPFFDALVDIHANVLRVELTPPQKPVQHSVHEQVMALQRGDWVDFTLSDGSRNRERLTWISPQRGILVFSNHHGQRAIQIAPEELVELVRTGKASIIPDHVADSTGQQSA